MTEAEASAFINEDMLSKLPGVGDEEVSAEEREMAKQVGRVFFASLSNKKTSSDAEEIAIPASVGRYRIFSHKMSPNQPLYKVEGSPEIERVLSSLYDNSRLEYSMVVASASSAGVADKPAAENERI
ncbi:hypothetical protein GGI23_002576, partial [Coemansia sp. RSA 2559]